ncbi:FlgK family flagellar hook-associated protein [Jannaschia pohangensis]|uniref:Flagellar hook-associated protein 1 n=1 Tax=Jannaschia pohangensis TaxID=390807 RepID=A0A1I3JV39_9RHOB|nr:flagellar basal body rod C-terminal domain-containing protein [Jannaschia pohangensis]SFI64127.1 flagellar hook-associated protein 1 FlgK [Jannaschia pohangensis]
MSLSSSLNFAVAGLDLSSRRAEVVARNVSSADLPGYARRTANPVGPGVGLPGSNVAIARESDPRLTQLRREAQSEQQGSSVARDFLLALEDGLGIPGDAGSLQSRLANLDAAFLAAASDPTSATRLGQVSTAADQLAKTLNGLDAIVLQRRQAADADIGKAVGQINSDLENIARLNTDILRLNSGGHDTADLYDQRTVLVDRISRQIPLRELPRDDGAIALVSESGVILLDGKAAELGFSARAPITAAMTTPIQLSGLSVNGKSVVTSGATSAIPGGGLQALFDLRDRDAPEANARLDALAADLISRFQSPTVDVSLAPGAAGLFTDNGAGYDPAADVGLAGRIEINGLVAPDRPDAHWRLRDGLGAAAPETGADASLLLRYGAAFAERSLPVASGLPAVAQDLTGLAASLQSLISSDRIVADDKVAFAATRAEGLIQMRDGGAVDIDAEMRRLIEVEQAYAANARVIQAVNDMMNRLSEI